MDNLTHSLAGMAAAELTSTIFAKRLGEFPDAAKSFRRWMIALSVLANNLPDLDLIYSMDTKLDYLVHHRGHTHTIAFAIPMALLLLAVPAVTNRWRPLGWKSVHWAVLSGVVIAGSFLHLIFDSANNYGVHPFWPFDKRWFYGDTIFIIEPWWWITLLGVFYHRLESWWGRLIGIGIAALALVASLWSGIVPGFVVLALGIGATVLLLAGSWLKQRLRPFVGLGAFLGVFLAFFLSKGRVKEFFYQDISRAKVGDLTSDISLTPYPANPFCWVAISATVASDDYVVSKAIVAPYPDLFPVQSCPRSFVDPGFAQLQAVEDLESKRVQWIGKLSQKRLDLAALAQKCEFRSFAKFARVPFWNAKWVGDLRFDRGGENPGFAAFARETVAASECPSSLPDWQEPRSDLLQGYL